MLNSSTDTLYQWPWPSSREAFTTSAQMDVLTSLDLLLFLWDAKAPSILAFVCKQRPILLFHLLLLYSKLLGYVLAAAGGFLLVSVHIVHTADLVSKLRVRRALWPWQADRSSIRERKEKEDTLYKWKILFSFVIEKTKRRSFINVGWNFFFKKPC